jgi:hypothetical protein
MSSSRSPLPKPIPAEDMPNFGLSDIQPVSQELPVHARPPSTKNEMSQSPSVKVGVKK